jgi:hypothetical protein
MPTPTMTPVLACTCGAHLPLDAGRGRDVECPACGRVVYVPGLAVLAMGPCDGRRVRSIGLSGPLVEPELPFFLDDDDAADDLLR